MGGSSRVHTGGRESSREASPATPLLALAGDGGCGALHHPFLFEPDQRGPAVLIPMILALLASPPVAWVGRISYSLYIWQQLFLVPGWENPSHFWTRWPWNMAVVLASACGSYYLVETTPLRVGWRLAAKFTVRSSEHARFTNDSLEPASG